VANRQEQVRFKYGCYNCPLGRAGVPTTPGARTYTLALIS